MQAEGVEVSRHAHVDDRDRGARLAGQHVDGRAAGDEVGDHLAGDLLWPWRHVFGQHAVVAGEHRDGGRGRQGRRVHAGDGGQLHAEGLEPAE